ncbi:hypothetical protein [Paenibacillus alvei]|uniref:hypothetical protein n=1 Tax=Paenibacillus alvei TaxID=44250 RepID=UPI0002894DBC|nr:hypothetical protein [Paenibacillus alvei]EJW14723.1 hypothetical protein PAV_11c00640 [Paenibacillus alvei DSM 29]MCY9540920.1 hypothetical protein [Paenibacillus alvei]MCY9708176.1 hypothetical protein [Paenibacillus alvei]MEC0080191.1 hypothetical protein [Paenibacillus alvei]NEZ43310.1 hypothetical protein [Paenibacillus alvei]
MSKAAAATTYTKEQILGSQRFSNVHKDILGALLDGSQQYTVEQAEKLIKDFEKKEAR